MIDTIGVQILLGENTGELTQYTFKTSVIETLTRSGYCGVTNIQEEIGEELKITVWISYPRYFYTDNAFLIKNKEECLKVQKEFVSMIRQGIGSLNMDENTVRINLTRVDIPFTYLMEKSETFNSYLNVFRILERIHQITIPKGSVKHWENSNQIETIYFCDSQNTSNYNTRICIYNQAKKFQDFYARDKNRLDYIYHNNPDLNQRIRIELSKKIRRKPFSLTEFENFDIYSEYVPSYAKYLLETLFNPIAIERVKENQVQHLRVLLLNSRNPFNFTYESFILRNEREILDYDILRRAIMETSYNPNSGYQGTSTSGKFLLNREKEMRILYIDVFKKIESIRKMIASYCEVKKAKF